MLQPYASKMETAATWHNIYATQNPMKIVCLLKAVCHWFEGHKKLTMAMA